ncbi:histidinol-phosphatase HisJ family protein [Petroclostridium sp. X23]|uniref:histidinol-phosphatase HisJ family protein n=1 Tax=Petroclostridium sp. X23 TaxID=3045146 RepID=UPI0024AE3EC5|nr:histidinol-phosphatase HisJ family protein [Petroclostridium sp. X23]WHH59927.1 histidinol-phosphatase HisJ family protein [Petroclostridium sp. X23]
MILHDYHIHSSFSGDSQMSMETACERAIALGLKEIAFTDHVDIDFPNSDPSFAIDYALYSDKFFEVKEKYKGRLKLVFGVEVGHQAHVYEENMALLLKYPFDFIILSTHVFDKLDIHAGDFCKGKSREQSYTRYLEGVRESLSFFNHYSVYGHIDLIRRYGGYKENCFHPGEFSHLLDDILKTIAHTGHGIEINTSGFKYGLGSPMPTLHILKRFKELGGEIITIGSDAHAPEHIAHHFDVAVDMLKEAGFKYIANFEQLQAKFELID